MAVVVDAVVVGVAVAVMVVFVNEIVDGVGVGSIQEGSDAAHSDCVYVCFVCGVCGVCGVCVLVLLVAGVVLL